MSLTYAPLRNSGGQAVGVLVLGVDQALEVPHDAQDAKPQRTAALALQHSLLPQPLHQPDDLEVVARYVAGSADGGAGGDWYDVIPIAAGRTALVVGDVMGRGLAAAAVMGQLRSTLRAYARLDLPPAEILGLLDAVVSELNPVQIATCMYACFDPVESVLTYATAGRPPPLLRRPDGSVQRLTAQPGAPLGLLDGP